MKRTTSLHQAWTKVVMGILISSLLVFLVSCSQTNEQTKDGTDSPESNSQLYSFTDDLGNKVNISQPERVVACMGSFADIWQLSGGTLVGATEDAFDEYLDSTDNIAKVGDFTSPNLEEIIALSPDFVIMTGASTGKDGAASQTSLRETLESSNITTAYFTVTTFDDYLRMLEICCGINERPDLLQTNGVEVKEKVDSLIEKSQQAENSAPSVLLMTTYSGGTRVQNSTSMTGAMLADLGATNLADENQSLLREFSLESVIEMNPEYILVVPMGNDDAAALKNLEEATAANPAWATLDAVKNGNYLTLEKQYFLYKPNEQWDTGYQILYDVLYGE